MARQAYNQNALARSAKLRGHCLTQSNVSRIYNGKQDPTLETLHAIADTLGIPDWYLLTEREGVEERIIRPPVPKNVVRLPSPYAATHHRPETGKAKKTRQK